MKRKMVALIVAAVMAMTAAACGGETAPESEGGNTEVNEGDLIYIDPFERHCFVNTGDEMMTLLGFQGV